MPAISMSRVVIVVPCFNEEHRLPADGVLELVARDDVGALLVDDGSTDGTRARLAEIARRRPDRIDVLGLDRNRGKAEAVRRGLLSAIDRGAAVVGYMDADMATPPAEVLRLVDRLDASPDVRVVLASRVAVLGARIQRKAHRHYLGRVFATGASLALGLPVYDTQCGAKVFRVDDALRRALAEPFSSRWAFDVELLGRLLPDSGPHGFIEVPLREWRDPGGSKLSLPAMLRAGADLAVIAAKLRARRKP